MFEIPRKTTKSLEGKFAMLAHNTSFDYWVLTNFTYSINIEESKEKKALCDIITFTPYGTYDISTDGHKQIISKRESGYEAIYSNTPTETNFDKLGIRKGAYRTSSTKILSKINGFHQNIKNIKGGEAVKIYKKKKKQQTTPENS